MPTPATPSGCAWRVSMPTTKPSTRSADWPSVRVGPGPRTTPGGIWGRRSGGPPGRRVLVAPAPVPLDGRAVRAGGEHVDGHHGRRAGSDPPAGGSGVQPIHDAHDPPAPG